MSTVNQLLSKAMSTTSEDEAIACLRMARKRENAGNIDAQVDDKHKDKSAEYWYKKAELYYKKAKEAADKLNAATSHVQVIIASLRASNTTNAVLSNKNENLRREVDKLKKDIREKDAKLSIAGFAIIVLFIALIIMTMV